jgi:hypothetical protein
MNRKTWIVLGTIAAAGLLVWQLQAQTYSPGPQPTIGDIQTQCVEQYPAPQTRTDVGIGEQVSCWIDTTTWGDTDIYTDPYGNQSNVSDTLGAITWSFTGAGASISPTVTYDSTPVTLTVDLVDTDDVVTVIATVTDSGKLGVDPPVQKQKVLNVKVPKGVNPIAYKDDPPGQPGTDLIGCDTLFTLQVIPQSVSFDNFKFQENIPQHQWTWPDGTAEQFPAKTIAFMVKTPNLGGLVLPNIFQDEIGLFGQGFPVSRLKDKTSGNNVDFDIQGPAAALVPLEYQDKNGKWIRFDNNGTRPLHFTGATLAGRAGIVVNAGTLWGGDQGPFKKPQ